MTPLESSELDAIVSAREREREWGATVRELVESEERGGSSGVSANQRVGREEEEGRVLGENVRLCDHPCRYGEGAKGFKYATREREVGDTGGRRVTEVKSLLVFSLERLEFRVTVFYRLSVV
jgi:hypothetical protein